MARRGTRPARRSCMATVFDPISSRIAEEVGYQAALMGGSLVSHFVLGAPDVNVLTLTEVAEQVWRCTRISEVPLLVDADHGYGNALSVMRTIQELERAGAAGVKVEDTLLPRAYGSSGAPVLLSREESADKARAAVKARGDSDMLVLGGSGDPLRDPQYLASRGVRLWSPGHDVVRLA